MASELNEPEDIINRSVRNILSYVTKNQKSIDNVIQEIEDEKSDSDSDSSEIVIKNKSEMNRKSLDKSFRKLNTLVKYQSKLSPKIRNANKKSQSKLREAETLLRDISILSESMEVSKDVLKDFRKIPMLARNDDTKTTQSSKFKLKKPFLYMSGANSKWVETLSPHLSHFYFFDASQSKDGDSSSFYDVLSANTADVLIFYVDSHHRNIHLVTEALFYISIGYDVILIVEPVMTPNFPECRLQLNKMRKNLVSVAKKYNVPVYKSVKDFVRDNKNKDDDITPKSLFPKTLKRKFTLQVTSKKVVKGEKRKIQKKIPNVDSIMFSEKPLKEVTSVGNNVTRDVKFSFSIDTTNKLAEYWGTVVYYVTYLLKNDSLHFNEKNELRVLQDYNFIKSLRIKSIAISDDLLAEFVSKILSEIIRQYSNVYLEDINQSLDYIMKHSDIRERIENIIHEDFASKDELFDKFAKNYVIPFIDDINMSRKSMKLKQALYPNVLKKDYREVLETIITSCDLADVKYYKSENRLEIDGTQINFTSGDYSIRLVYHILRHYFNTHKTHMRNAFNASF